MMYRNIFKYKHKHSKTVHCNNFKHCDGFFFYQQNISVLLWIKEVFHLGSFLKNDVIFENDVIVAS